MAGRKAHQTTKTQPHRLGQNVNAVFFQCSTVYSVKLDTVNKNFSGALSNAFMCQQLPLEPVLAERWMIFTSIISNHQILTSHSAWLSADFRPRWRHTADLSWVGSIADWECLVTAVISEGTVIKTIPNCSSAIDSMDMNGLNTSKYYAMLIYHAFWA